MYSGDQRLFQSMGFEQGGIQWLTCLPFTAESVFTALQQPSREFTWKANAKKAQRERLAPVSLTLVVDRTAPVRRASDSYWPPNEWFTAQNPDPFPRGLFDGLRIEGTVVAAASGSTARPTKLPAPREVRIFIEANADKLTWLKLQPVEGIQHDTREMFPHVEYLP